MPLKQIVLGLKRNCTPFLRTSMKSYLSNKWGAFLILFHAFQPIESISRKLDLIRCYGFLFHKICKSTRFHLDRNRAFTEIEQCGQSFFIQPGNCYIGNPQLGIAVHGAIQISEAMTKMLFSERERAQDLFCYA